MKFFILILGTLFTLGLTACSPKTHTAVAEDNMPAAVPAPALSPGMSNPNAKPLPHGAQSRTQVKKLEIK